MSKKLDSHLKEKGTYFVSVTHDLELANKMIEVLPDFKYWAWIKHQPDTEDGTEHVHFLVRNNGTRSIAQVADKLGISGQYVQVCRNVYGFRRYMLHLDSEEKIQYTLDDVHTSSIVSFRECIDGSSDKDIHDMYSDYRDLCSGMITVDDFLERNYVEFQKMTAYQKVRLFDMIRRVHEL